MFKASNEGDKIIFGLTDTDKWPVVVSISENSNGSGVRSILLTREQMIDLYSAIGFWMATRK